MKQKPGSPNWSKPKSWHGLTYDQKDFGGQIVRLAGLYTSAIIIASKSNDTVFNSASGFLLNTGAKTLLITNAHVLDFFLNLRQTNSDVVFVYCGEEIEPKIVDCERSEEIDLAILDVTGVTFQGEENGYWDSEFAKTQTYKPANWPHDPPRTGEYCVVVGWPAKYRSRDSSREVEFAAFPFLGVSVDNVSESWFTIPFSREDYISSDFDPSNQAVFETALEGMSGCPVFVMHRSKLIPIELIGIVRSYGETFDILYCTRSDIIMRDGSIRRTR